MKILFIRSTYKFSGAERHNAELLWELKKYLDVTLLTNLGELRREGINVRIENWLPEEVGTKKQLLKILFYAPIFIPRYLPLVKNVDVICLQSRTEMIFLTPILRFLKKKVVWIQHGPFFVSKTAGIVKSFYGWASRLTDGIIAVSKDTKRDLVKGGVFEKKITVICSGVDTKQFVPRVSHRTFTVGFLGSVTKEKGIEDFITATKNFHALVIGDGPDLKRMKRQSRNCTFTGFVEDVQSQLQKIDVLLLPTRHHEGISMAILEAQAIGIPVLTTDIGGNREIITHGYNGFLYKPGDTESMAFDIRMLAKNRKNLFEMGRHARKIVLERFNMAKQGKLFADYFRSI